MKNGKSINIHELDSTVGYQKQLFTSLRQSLQQIGDRTVLCKVHGWKRQGKNRLCWQLLYDHPFVVQETCYETLMKTDPRTMSLHAEAATFGENSFADKLWRDHFSRGGGGGGIKTTAIGEWGVNYRCCPLFRCEVFQNCADFALPPKQTKKQRHCENTITVTNVNPTTPEQTDLNISFDKYNSPWHRRRYFRDHKQCYWRQSTEMYEQNVWYGYLLSTEKRIVLSWALAMVSCHEFENRAWKQGHNFKAKPKPPADTDKNPRK